TSHSLVLRAYLSQHGLHGEIEFSHKNERLISIRTNLQTTLQYPDGVFRWTIHEFPVDYRDLTNDRCSEANLGKELIDLTEELGYLIIPGKDHAEFESVNTLTGKDGLWGKSIVLETAERGRVICASILSTEPMYEKYAMAKFTAPIAGTLEFRWLSATEFDETDSYIQADLYHAKHVTEKEEYTEHNWKLFVTDIFDSDKANYEDNCNVLQVVFDPESNDNSRSVGDLDSRLGQIKVATEANVKKVKTLYKHEVINVLRSDMEVTKRSLYVVIYDNKHSQSFLAYFTQRSPFEPTWTNFQLGASDRDYESNLRFVNSVATYSIRELPPKSAALGDMETYCLSTQDQYPVGDLFGKYKERTEYLNHKYLLPGLANELNGVYWDTYLPLQGIHSVLHRALVVERASQRAERSVLGHLPATAGDTQRAASRTGLANELNGVYWDTYLPLQGIHSVLHRALVVERASQRAERSVLGHLPATAGDTQRAASRTGLANELNGVYWDTYLPLQGIHSVLHRALVVERASQRAERSVLGHLPATAGDTQRAASRTGSREIPMSSALVIFRYPVVGRVIFRQPQDRPWEDTTVIIESMVHADGSNLNNTHEHRWAIHENPPGGDYYNWTGRCLSAGGVFEPHHLDIDDRHPEMYCRTGLEGLCKLGDFTTSDLLTRRLFTDTAIALSGMHSIMRKTLLIYDDHGPVARGERMAFLWREISSSLAKPQLCMTRTTHSTSAKRIYRLLYKSREGRWACSSIERGYSPSEAREIRGIASFHHPGGFAWGYVRMTQLIHNDGSAKATVQVTNTRCVAGGYRWNPYFTQLADPLNSPTRGAWPVSTAGTLTSRSWLTLSTYLYNIFVNPVGVDATVQVTNTRCVAGGYRWNPYFTQLADPLNRDLYEQECGADNPLRCDVGIGGARQVFMDSSFPLEGTVSAMGRSLVIFGPERSGERFACANIEPDKDIIKFVNIMKPPRFVLGQFLSEVRRVLGVPEWMLSVDARRTRALHHAACVQFLKMKFKMNLLLLFTVFYVTEANLEGPFLFFGPKSLEKYRRPALKYLEQDDLMKIYAEQAAIVVFNNQDSVPLSSGYFPRLRKMVERETTLVLPQDFLDTEYLEPDSEWSRVRRQAEETTTTSSPQEEEKPAKALPKYALYNATGLSLQAPGPPDAPSAVLGKSYHCPLPLVYSSEEATLTLPDVQVIFIYHQSGLLVTFIMLIGIAISITMIMDIRTMDRFETSRSKQLTITVIE
ncbi:Superoxide dismutase (Cu-Zn), partial [Operophtera brumata]